MQDIVWREVSKTWKLPRDWAVNSYKQVFSSQHETSVTLLSSHKQLETEQFVKISK